MPTSDVPAVLPVLGGAGVATSTSPSATGGSAADGGIVVGGAGGGSSPSDATALTAALMVPMVGAPDADRVWTSLSPQLRAGDVVVAQASGDVPGFLAFSDRVRTDAPSVSYFVSVSDLATLKSIVEHGLPATITGVGLANVDASDVATLGNAATLVHGAGKKLLVSTTAFPTKATLGEIGARADVVELVLAAAVELGLATTDDSIAADQVATASAALRTTGKPLVFIRLPQTVASSTTRVTAMGRAIVGRTAFVGIAFPWADGLGDLMSSFRKH